MCEGVREGGRSGGVTILIIILVKLTPHNQLHKRTS